MAAMQFDGRQHVLHRRTMHAPSAQPSDLQHGLLRRQDQLSGGSDVEFLQHLQADTAPALEPETRDQLDGNPPFIPGSRVEGVDQDVGIDKLAMRVNAHATSPGSR
jgi:hypothetical protein